MAEANKKTKTTKETPALAEDAITNAEVQEVVAEKTETSAADSTPAKAGKRSAKALEAAEEKAAKEERKAAKAGTDLTGTEEKPKQKQNPTRPKIERQGKNFRKVSEQIDANKVYSLEEALELATKTSPVKFDATVELHVNLRVDPRHADQNIRDNFVLPQGTGKTVRVAVFADVDDAAAAKKAGADVAGIEEVTKMLDKGQMDFDILVATPSQMAKLGKYARALGPRGLMPNPKSGTVTTDVARAVAEAKAGRVEYRVDSTGIVHLGFGKVSFGRDRLMENAQAVLANIRSNKPGSVKGSYVKSIHISTTMGPSIAVEASAL
jgi:large subunit ribosomal protein L1